MALSTQHAKETVDTAEEKKVTQDDAPKAVAPLVPAFQNLSLGQSAGTEETKQSIEEYILEIDKQQAALELYAKLGENIRNTRKAVCDKARTKVDPESSDEIDISLRIDKETGADRYELNTVSILTSNRPISAHRYKSFLEHRDFYLKEHPSSKTYKLLQIVADALQPNKSKISPTA